jgi:hypothetical protein
MPGTIGFRLDAEQRARVCDCLRKADLTLPGAVFERFVRDIEGSISRFFTLVPSPTLRETHDALRAVWLLACEGDPQVGVLRARIKTLPKTALEYINGRAPRVIPRLFPGETLEDGAFLVWAERADGGKLVKALRGLAAQGAQIVEGRSRASGKRSARRTEPSILGAVRGTGVKGRNGGRPSEDARHELVMNLGLDWIRAANQMPEPGRSSESAFGDLVHSVFQWLNITKDPYEAATYALRRHWEKR